ncbi:MAG TPA: archease [Actinomycetota bacterium]|nr:archease [Actinomycetota bacterium]
MSPFEILEHTADVGVRAEAAELTELFAEVTFGLLDISGAWAPGPGERVDISVQGGDLGATLVDWLEGVLYLQDARDSVITSVTVEAVSPEGATGWVEIAPRTADLEGTAVKAITYHQLEVRRTETGMWVAVVYFDI